MHSEGCNIIKDDDSKIDSNSYMDHEESKKDASEDVSEPTASRPSLSSTTQITNPTPLLLKPSNAVLPPAYHPAIMFCGECTSCSPEEGSLSSLPPSNGVLMNLTHIPNRRRRKIVSKMFYISSNDVNIITNDDDMEQDSENKSMEQVESIRGRNIKDKQRCGLYVANLSQHSQLLLITKVLTSMAGILEVQHYWNSSAPGINNADNNDDYEKRKHIDIFYDPLAVSMDKIISALQALNLDASVIKGDQTMLDDVESSKVKKQSVRSSMHVEGICCASEVPQVTSILRKLSGTGVEKVSINITSRMVYVDHFSDEISATELADALNQEGFGATVRKDGGCTVLKNREVAVVGEGGDDVDSGTQRQDSTTSATTKNAFSSLDLQFVESTLLCPSLTTFEEGEVVQDMLSENRQLQGIVRYVAPNLPSRSIKIQHNPTFISAQALANMLMDVGGYANVTVLVDGQEEGLYLPNSMNIDAGNGNLDSSRWRYKYKCQKMLPKGLGVNIVVSGVFWFVSLLGHFVENLDYLKYFGLVSVAFGIPSVAMKAFRTLKRKHFDANCMMVTAAIGSVCLQEYDEAASVSFLFAISEFLEEQATKRATKALDSIINMRPDHANLIVNQDKDDVIVVPVNDLKIGNLVSVRTGDQIPSDGIVVEGISQIDESSLTGESTLITKKPGDTVSGGTINAGMSPLRVRIVALVEDSAVSRLVRLVEESASNRSPTEQIVDAFAKSYTPTVIVVAILMCTIPWFIDVDIGKRWVLNGLILVVIACPCALTISTPVTYAAGLAATAQKGIIVKGGSKLEALGSVRTVIFDKTGTLTEGRFRLNHLDIVGTKKTRQEVLALLAVLEAPSSHPLAATLVNAAKAEGIERPTDMQVLNHSILQGEGVTALVDGVKVYVGNQTLFQRLGMYNSLDSDLTAKANLWSEEGGTVGFLGIQGLGIVGMFCVSDAVRSDARSVISSLLNDGVKVMMLTGDGDGAARAVAKEVGLPFEYVQSRLSPDAKLHCVASQLGLSRRTSTLFSKKELLLFVGDGVNDGPALAVSDIGVAMGEGAALAMELSDVTLMDSNLSKLLFSIEMGRKVVLTVQENIIVSVVAKLVVILLTFAGKMTLLGAIASDVGVMLLVSMNGMKLLPSGPRLFCGKKRYYYSKVPISHQIPTGELA